jgi:hypothetical protein
MQQWGAVPFFSSVYRQIYLAPFLLHRVVLIFFTLYVPFLSMFGRISDIRLTSCCKICCKVPPQPKDRITAAAFGAVSVKVLSDHSWLLLGSY